MWFVVKGGWPQMILLFLIMRCTPTIRELIEATPLSPSSPSATSLSALAPAQRAGAHRLCATAQNRHGVTSDLSPLCAQKRTLTGPCALILYVPLNDLVVTLSRTQA